MFYSSTDGQYIQEGTAFVIAGVQYPQNWLNLSTAQEKAQIGLEEVVATNSPANDQYYWITTELNGASLTYVNTPKDLTQVKTNATNQINTTAYTLLAPSDWMVTKSIETNTPVATEWTTYRQSVRTVANEARGLIDQAIDVDAVAGAMANIAWPKNPLDIDKTEA